MKGHQFEAFASQLLRLYRSMEDEKLYNKMLRYAEKNCTEAQWIMLQKSIQRVKLELVHKRLEVTDSMEVIRE